MFFHLDCDANLWCVITSSIPPFVDHPCTFSGVAAIVMIVVCILMLVFSGYMVEINSVLPWLSWLQWLSATRYASNILVINEFKDLTFCQSNSTTFCPLSGKALLTKQALDHQTDWDLWKHVLALFLMTVTFFLLALMQLFRTKKRK